MNISFMLLFLYAAFPLLTNNCGFPQLICNGSNSLGLKCIANVVQCLLTIYASVMTGEISKISI